MRPVNPARIKRSVLSTSRTDGPQRVQVCVSVIKRHTRETGASMWVPTSSVNRICSASRSVERPLPQRIYRMIFQVLKTPYALANRSKKLSAIEVIKQVN
jgi:hypothetical protein